ncbi:agmatinase [Pseudomonas sp. RIT-PI-q]|uniref:agmatinase n=1 Tax=Pseudomonas sp. RIT-PI-q TaxID=1690247 RepID=UPI0006CCF79F|nr:agmatinase [Pseudomonas sp. RIT-PI-q]KPH01583.1 agmatinase [Pseudomonas sp. RIT-PI-q]
MEQPVIDQAITRESLYGTDAESTFGGITSFMRRRYTKDLRGVDLVVSGVPFDTATSNRPGSRFGPRAIRQASAQSAWARHWPWKVDPFDVLACIDFGDCDFDYGTPQETPADIRAHAEHILAAGAGMLTLGGDHFITYPLLQAHAAKHGPLSLIHFDAHHDTESDGESKRIDHGSMFYHAVREGLVDPSRSTQIGLRISNDQPMGFQVINARQVHSLSPAEIAAAICARVGDHPVYLTFDIDCLDPAFAPGTGTPVCGGLSTHQAFEILRGLQGINLVGMDVVEVAPPYDHAEITALAGAAIAMEMVCLYAANPQR